jgi:hypothetical protein
MCIICPHISKVTDAVVVSERVEGEGPQVIAVISLEHRDQKLGSHGGCQDHVLLSVCIVEVPWAICR